jgi:hypothetical protein
MPLVAEASDNHPSIAGVVGVTTLEGGVANSTISGHFCDINATNIRYRRISPSIMKQDSFGKT